MQSDRKRLRDLNCEHNHFKTYIKKEKKETIPEISEYPQKLYSQPYIPQIQPFSEFQHVLKNHIPFPIDPNRLFNSYRFYPESFEQEKDQKYSRTHANQLLRQQEIYSDQRNINIDRIFEYQIKDIETMQEDNVNQQCLENKLMN